MNKHILALFLLAVASAALAQKQWKPAEQGPSERQAMLQSLQRGKEITAAGGQLYRHLPEVKAVEGKAGAAGEVIETKGRLVLYRGSATDSVALERAGKSMVYPTVVNTRTGALGVLTGVLVVKPKNMSDAEAIASSNGLQVSKAFPHLQTVFYKAKPGEDIADLSAALQADPRVESAYPEIIERVRTPK
jgi:preprotein translocase subunit YajC